MGQIVFLSNGKNETMLELIQFKDAEKVSMSGIVMSYSTDEKFDALRERALHLGYSPTKIIWWSRKCCRCYKLCYEVEINLER